MQNQSDRLKAARESAGYETATDAARAYGWKEVTYLAHENGGRGLRPDVAKKYATAFGVSAAYLLTGERSMTGANVLATDKGKPIKHMPFGGVLEAGAFRELEMYAQDAHQPPALVPRDPRFDRMRQTSFLVRGDSMNQANMPDGTMVATVDYIDFCEWNGDARNGAFVVVERSRDGGHTVERTVKEVHRVKGGLEFRPRSDNPVHRPFVIPRQKADDGTEVRIIAVVVGIYLPLSV